MGSNSTISHAGMESSEYQRKLTNTTQRKMEKRVHIPACGRGPEWFHERKQDREH